MFALWLVVRALNIKWQMSMFLCETHTHTHTHTLQVTTYLSRLTVHIDLWQAGRLFRCRKGLKLAEVGEIGLLGNLLGGGGGEHCSASRCTLSLYAMPSVWCWRLEREEKGGVRASVLSRSHLIWCDAVRPLICCIGVPERIVCLTCVGSGRGGTAGG